MNSSDCQDIFDINFVPLKDEIMDQISALFQNDASIRKTVSTSDLSVNNICTFKFLAKSPEQNHIESFWEILICQVSANRRPFYTIVVLKYLF